jgi:hypothetical protein
MVGLDPTIHAAGEAVDPRVKPEDDEREGVDASEGAVRRSADMPTPHFHIARPAKGR